MRGGRTGMHEIDDLKVPAERDMPPARLLLRKERLMQALDSDAATGVPTTSQGSRPSRWRRRSPLLIAAALVVLSGAAVAWAFVASSARDTVTVNCQFPDGSSTGIPSASGDPVA